MDGLSTLLEILQTLVGVVGGIALAVVGFALVRRVSPVGGVLVGVVGLVVSLSLCCVSALSRGLEPGDIGIDAYRWAMLIPPLFADVLVYVLLIAAVVLVGRDVAARAASEGGAR